MTGPSVVLLESSTTDLVMILPFTTGIGRFQQICENSETQTLKKRMNGVNVGLDSTTKGERNVWS